MFVCDSPSIRNMRGELGINCMARYCWNVPTTSNMTKRTLSSSHVQLFLTNLIGCNPFLYVSGESLELLENIVFDAPMYNLHIKCSMS
jgi:hypothetical protein